MNELIMNHWVKKAGIMNNERQNDSASTPESIRR